MWTNRTARAVFRSAKASPSDLLSWVPSWDSNVYFNTDGLDVANGAPVFAGLNWTSWREAGFDNHSAVGDPGFESYARNDWRFRPGSLASKLGIAPIDPWLAQHCW